MIRHRGILSFRAGGWTVPVCGGLGRPDDVLRPSKHKAGRREPSEAPAFMRGEPSLVRRFDKRVAFALSTVPRLRTDLATIGVTATGELNLALS
jgi:hypothetical protein